MGFRKDINGLRAIAVTAVVLFHFGVGGFSGGFAGVDVFFVISGFLMTQQIVERLDSSTFSITEFYAGRVRRILPALTVLCATLVIAGWFLLAPQAFRALGKHSYTSLLFISNFTFWLEDNYFDEAARAKWLLHTWSLSVEWQFYLIYPVIILASNRFFRREKLIHALTFLFIASYASSVAFSNYYASASFYLLPFRGWEMIAGGLVYLLRRPISGTLSLLFEVIGIVLVMASIFCLDQSAVWPGWLAMLPVLGTAMIIFANRQKSPFTTTPVSAFLGRISYSIYLWHWPIVVALYYRGLSASPVAIAIGIGLSVMLGWLSFTFVESASRRRDRRPAFLLLPQGIISVAAMVCIASASVFAAHGIPQRASPAFRDLAGKLALAQTANGWCFYSVDTDKKFKVGGGQNCYLGSKSPQATGLLFGDSYAGQYDPFWDKIAKENNLSINSVTTNWCFPSLQQTFTHPSRTRALEQCLSNRRYVEDHISQYPFIVLAGQWPTVISEGNFPEVEAFVDEASKKTNVLILMAAPAKFDINPRLVFESALFAGYKSYLDGIPRTVDEPVKAANEKVKALAGRYPNVIFISREEMFSTADRGQAIVDKTGIPYTVDGNHISIHGAEAAADNFMQTDEYAALKRRLQAASPTSPNLSLK